MLSETYQQLKGPRKEPLAFDFEGLNSSCIMSRQDSLDSQESELASSSLDDIDPRRDESAREICKAWCLFTTLCSLR